MSPTALEDGHFDDISPNIWFTCAGLRHLVPAVFQPRLRACAEVGELTTGHFVKIL
jgi:hypothetical protein